ncbi:hypothetical protein STANM309S_04123 [Streptomyces tanashiensis]
MSATVHLMVGFMLTPKPCAASTFMLCAVRKSPWMT